MTTSRLLTGYIQARWFTEGKWSNSVIVLHSMEAPMSEGRAKQVAQMFATLPPTRKASVQVCVDNKELWGCVSEQDTAYGAPGANSTGLHIEHAGYAKQSREDWLSDYGVAMLRNSARLAADWCNRYGIPVEFVDAEGLRRGQRGITTHYQVALAFGGDHWDPGPDFPLDYYLELVKFFATPPAPPEPPATISGDDNDEGEQMNGACRFVESSGTEHTYSSRGDGHVDHSWTAPSFTSHYETIDLYGLRSWPQGLKVSDSSPMFAAYKLPYWLGFKITTVQGPHVVVIYNGGQAPNHYTCLQL